MIGLRAPAILVLLAMLPFGARAERPADHVVLISVDGLRPDFYLEPRWPAPMLQRMARRGVHAKGVTSVFPSVTYPSHTTLITGALPARHGIVNNSPFEPGGQTGRWYWQEEAIRVPTLWDAVRAAGLQSASLGWPVSVGAPVEWNLPEIWSLDPDRTAIDVMKEVTTPAGLWAEIEREATGRLTAANFDHGLLARDDKAGEAAAYLLATFKPALLTVHLLEVDYFQHEQGREGDDVPRAVAAADRAISRIVEAAERAGMLDRTAFLVTGDHGFIDYERQLRPNVWLVEAGLQEAAADRGEWRATFHTGAAAALLYPRNPEDRQAAELARAALERRPAGERRLFRIVERAELDRLGADPAAVFALSPTPGTTISGSAEPPAISPASGANHGYLPEMPQMRTGFVAWGAGLASGAAVTRMHLSDVAPVVAQLLALDFEAPDGELPRGILAE